MRKLLAKDPRQRYQTANEVIEALQVVPAAAREPVVAEIAARMRHHHDEAEARRLEEQRQLQAERDSAARNRYKEQELFNLLDEAVAEINEHLQETKIHVSPGRDGKQYRFGNRLLNVHFFRSGELFENPEVPGRMETLRRRHAVHGGFIEIKEDGEDRQGWNLVLVRPPDDLYGEWRIVETRVSALSRRAARYEPFATEARLFADNLACHWAPAMHVFVLTDKALERGDILKILQVFIPGT
jgi:predicted DNA-binding protein (UPF0251 family)